MYENLQIKRNITEPTILQIERFLENLIGSGQLQIGTRLPSTLKLSKCWQVNLVSVQKAMVRLSAKGLIKRKSNLGTFVKNRVANISLGIISGVNLINEDSNYYRILVESLRQEIHRRGWSITIYDALNEYLSDKYSCQSDLYGKLKHDIDNYIWRNCLLIGTGMWTLKDVGIKSVINSVRCNQVYQYTDIMFDYAHFARESINWCVRKGYKNIFCLNFLHFPEAVHGVNEAVTANRLQHFPEMHNFNLSAVHRNEKKIFEETLSLIEKWERNNNIPDALIVPDDIAMRPVALALLQKNIRIPEQLRIMVMANEEIEHIYGVPVNRYVFNASEKAKKALDLLLSKISEEHLPELPILVKGRIVEDNN